MESALLAALGAVLILFAFYMPVLGVVVALASPLPAAFAVIRHGGRWGLLTSIVSILALLPFVDWITAVGLWILYGWVGLAFGIAVRRQYSAGLVLAVTALAFVFGVLSVFVTSYLVTGLSLFDFVDQLIKSVEIAVRMNERILGPNPVLDQIAASLSERDVLLKMIPSTVVLSSLLLAYVNIEVFRRVMPRFGYNIEGLPPFSRWIFPEIVAWIGLLGLLGIPYLPMNAMKTAAENIFIIVAFLAHLQALSFISFFLLRAGFPRLMTGLVVVFVLSVTLTAPGFSFIASFFGMIDMLFDFRRVRYGLA